ncbi:MAG: phenylalanine--tRNA ligase subunit beta, partial [Xanthomonadaceae bacterium]|nr:phenylalanine--tRNA ligase subunit beta [Xanthomonadaceae bacterium]
LRSRSPVVDVTNYVLLELGQPMHAFDLDQIEGGIRVRRTAPGESIRLLDGQTIEPDQDMLLICDHQRPLALAGIMGGQESAVGEATRNILLESAWFNPATIIGKARRLGLSTDSSHRFERGVDPCLQHTAIERATALILEIAGGRAGPVVEQCASEHLPVQAVIGLRVDRVNRLLGTSLQASEIEAILKRLDMSVEVTPAGFDVRPPSARRDLAIEVDLIEEIARLVGYDALPIRAPGGRLHANVESERSVDLRRLRDTLQGRGFQEIMTWSFVSGDDLERLSMQADAQPLANPLSQEMGVLRTRLLPGLLRTASSNLRHQHARLKLFESGHTFIGGDTPGETSRLGLLVAGDAVPESWHVKRRPFDFFDLKGEVEHLLACIGHAPGALECRADPHAWLHPGQSASLVLDGQHIGYLGQLHPAIAASIELGATVFVAELDLEPIRRRTLPQFAGSARFPSVRRDLALIVPESVAAAQLQHVAGHAAGKLLESCIIFDIYQGKEIDSGFKSVAIGLILRNVSRTLTDQEVDAVIEDVVESLKKECQVTIRG